MNNLRLGEALVLGRDVLVHVNGRVKSIDSILAKCGKKGYEPTYESALEKSMILSASGRYALLRMMYTVWLRCCTPTRILKILKRKDYIKAPKSSGYRSLHLIVEIPVYFQGKMEWVRAELQLRTPAMDFWAGVDHQLRYKKGKQEAILIGEELKQYSQVVAELDQKMMELRKRIDAI